MGLDVYFYKIKNRSTWKTYKNTSKEYDDYSDFLWTKYDKETTKAYNKYRKWYDNLEERYDSKKITAEQFDKEVNESKYTYQLTDFVSSDEKLKYNLLKSENDKAKNDCWNIELEGLYMRKQYWFIQYCYNKFRNYMTDNERFDGKILSDDHYYDVTLTKEDIKDIIGKLEQLVNCPEDKKIIADEKYVDLKELLSGNANNAEKTHKVKYIDSEYFNSIFPIYNEFVHSARPNWNYQYDTIEFYLNKFTDVYNQMDDENLIFVSESW